MTSPTEPGDRLTAFGNQLIEVHIGLRRRLRRLREEADSYLDGRGNRPRDLRKQLQEHCLAFCSALDRHHTGEDGGVFPALAARFPELRDTLDRLSHDHQMVAGILVRLESLVGGISDDPGPDEARRVRGEMDGLSAIMDSHFGYEERTLARVLNSLSESGHDPPFSGAGVEAVFRLPG
ncbi:hemerythrin domain-containing protein [Sinosporangium siamense]|uniref:hemerythrin domain-containing protein n=1 Tax=Sinosporangium siamense TaxID=1367973 RepID=UPI00194DB4DE|nr:hemerythrin domain-containing protein [Sinosporangium siamense]